MGAGTTALVAMDLGRDFIGFELNPEYAELSRRRILDDAGFFSNVQLTKPDVPEPELDKGQ